MIETLIKYSVKVLFVVGGDGTFHAAHILSQEINKRKLPISIIAIPKTIDNDIVWSVDTFGFHSAVDVARDAIYAAHEEAKSVVNGVGLVKLMGRDSGFIASYASLANSDVNFCLIPEVNFKLHGESGLLGLLEKRFRYKKHAVIVVAEGSGQDLMSDEPDPGKDASGNIIYKDIGIFLKKEIEQYFANKKQPIHVKYIDPSYTIRGCPANAFDSAFCLMLGQNAVHAGLSGRTDMFVGFWNQAFVNVPLGIAVGKKKRVDPCDVLWQTLLETTKQVD